MTAHPAFQKGKTAVITGAAGGIGLAAAKRFAGLGLNVCMADREAEALKTAAEGVAALAREGGGQVLAAVADVSDEGQVRALRDAVLDKFGAVHVLMNNAGVAGGGQAFENPEGWRRVLGVNLMGVVNGVQAFAPAMIEAGEDGVIVNTGSKQGITTPPGDTAYNVSKAGVKALTEGLAHSLRNIEGGRLSAHLLIPGFTYTGMTSGRHTEKPAGAWTAEQVVDEMIAAIGRGDFYILCEDGETTRAMDEKRIAWAAGDIIENRPALSRWHPDWKEKFAAWMAS